MMESAISQVWLTSESINLKKLRSEYEFNDLMTVIIALTHCHLLLIFCILSSSVKFLH
jgi:hypothetical protein